MTLPFFQPSSDLVKPYALMDLDDTLFQTQRKIAAWNLPSSDPEQLVCATVNKQGEPLSFMTQRQATMFNWLLTSTELIAVTARDTQEIMRVKLPLTSWQVLTHGAVILQADGSRQTEWQSRMYRQLAPLQDKLQALIKTIKHFNSSQSETLKLAIHSDSFGEDNGNSDGNSNGNINGNSNGNSNDNNKVDNVEIDDSLIIYLAIKHSQKDHHALASFAKELPKLVANLTDDFYIHLNANNCAILPHTVHKRHAVQFLLDHCLDPERPSFGFGDSLADLPFLQLLDWYGTPNHGQLHDSVTTITQPLKS